MPRVVGEGVVWGGGGGRGGRGGVAVGVGQQRHGVAVVGQFAEFRHEFVDGGVVHFVGGGLEAVGGRGVVDVLRGEAEVDEFTFVAQFQRVHLLLDEVFDGLDVVVGGLFDLLDAFGVAQREVLVDVAQGGVVSFVKVGELRKGQFAQGDEVFDFDLYAVADQGKFRKVVAQLIDFAAVASIDGRNGCESVQFHGY